MTEMRSIRAKRWLTVGALGFGAATLLAACGSSGGSAGGAQAASVVSVHNQSGVGDVLVNSAGRTLYSAEQEKSGTIACTGTCTSFWSPLTVAKNGIAKPAGLSGTLGTVKRPDSGKLQVTYNGSPLYTFKLDTASGDTKGNNFSDKFGAASFTWHAASSGKLSSSPTKNSGGYGNY
jgi:predicted lipoprotein with Yx(FWY)xxD motif